MSDYRPLVDANVHLDQYKGLVELRLHKNPVSGYAMEIALPELYSHLVTVFMTVAQWEQIVVDVAGIEARRAAERVAEAAS